MDYGVQMARFVIRAPDHLGDATMAIPAMRAIADLGETVVYGPRLLGGLFEALDVRSVTVRPGTDLPAEGTGVLFKPSFGAAWRWRHLPRRVGLAINGRSALLTDPVVEPAGAHRREGYAAIAAVLGAVVPGKPATPQRSAGGRGSIIALNPWSPSETVRWPHFRALADRLAAELPAYSVVFFAGPGEEAAVRDLAGSHPVVAGLPLVEFAAALQDVALFVSNDSGAAHFADAVGVPVLMIHGSTDARRTGTGAAVSGGPIWCGPCYRKTCFLGRTCLERIPVDVVVERARGVLDRLFGSG